MYKTQTLIFVTPPDCDRTGSPANPKCVLSALLCGMKGYSRCAAPNTSPTPTRETSLLSRCVVDRKRSGRISMPLLTGFSKIIECNKYRSEKQFTLLPHACITAINAYSSTNVCFKEFSPRHIATALVRELKIVACSVPQIQINSSSCSSIFMNNLWILHRHRHLQEEF